jgi:hypothetical protein
MKALSIRQPYAELILLGKKKEEYRSRKTNVRGKIYIYASKTPADKSEFKKSKLLREDLPVGVIVGTVEITGCRKRKNDYAWKLEDPVRLKRPFKPENHPNPVWFYPTKKK